MEAEAKVSLDSSDFSAGAQKVGRSSDEMAARSEAAATKMGRSLGGLDDISLKSSRKVAGNLKAIELALLSGADTTTLLQLGLLKVAESFKLGFGGTIALAGLSVAAAKISETIQKADELKKHYRDALDVNPAQGTQGPEALRRRIADIDAVLAEDKPPAHVSERVTRGAADFVTSTWARANSTFDLLTGHGSMRDIADIGIGPERMRQGNRGRAQDERGEKLYALIEGESKVNDLREQGARAGERSVKVAELELEQKRKLADLETGLGIPQLRNRLADSHPGEERDAIQRELNDKRFTLDGLTKQANREYGLRKRIAETDDVREGDRRWYQRERSDVGAITDLPGDAEQKYGSTKAAQMRNIDHTAALQDRQRLAEAGLDTSDADQKVRATENAYKAELRSLKERNDELTEQTRIQGFITSGQVTAAKNASQILPIEQAIKQAKEDSRDADGALLQIQKQRLQTLQALEKFEHPERVNADRGAARSFDQRVNRMTVDAGLTNVTHDSSGLPVGGYDNSIQSYRNTTPAERAAAMAARASRKLYDGSTRAREARGVGLIPDNAGLPDNAGIPDNAGPGNLSDYDAKNGGPKSSVRMSNLLSPAQMYAMLPRGLDAVLMRAGTTGIAVPGTAAGAFGLGVAEANRPQVPSREESPTAAINALLPDIRALVNSLNKAATKIGVA